MRLETPVLSAALCKSSRILQSRILGQFAGFLFYQRPVPKLQKATLFALFGEAEFWDSMPVLALECFFVYGIGVLISEFSVS